MNRLDFLEKNADQKEEWWTSSESSAADDEDQAMEGVVQGDVEAKVSQYKLDPIKRKYQLTSWSCVYRV